MTEKFVDDGEIREMMIRQGLSLLDEMLAQKEEEGRLRAPLFEKCGSPMKFEMLEKPGRKPSRSRSPCMPGRGVSRC